MLCTDPVIAALTRCVISFGRASPAEVTFIYRFSFLSAFLSPAMAVVGRNDFQLSRQVVLLLPVNFTCCDDLRLEIVVTGLLLATFNCSDLQFL